MSNLTLSIDDDILKKAKLKTVQEGVSLSAKVRELLQRYALGQLDSVAPDLSFAENALRYSDAAEAKNRLASAEQSFAPDQVPAPLGPDGLSVDPNYLRSIRGWAREDLYERPATKGD